MDIATALLLTIFICIDFPNLKRGFRRLQDTWLRDVYDEMAPALSALAGLVGKSMHAQGLIAMCNAIVLIFIALHFLGVESTISCSAWPPSCCAWCRRWARLSPWWWFRYSPWCSSAAGRSLLTAARRDPGDADRGVFVLKSGAHPRKDDGAALRAEHRHSCRLHRHFFGVWGLILATPVAVYVIHVLILRSGLPGSEGKHEPAAPQTTHALPDEEKENGPGRETTGIDDNGDLIQNSLIDDE